MQNGIAAASNHSNQPDRSDGHRMLIEKAISCISIRFVNIFSTDKSIQDSLADLGMLTGATHAYLLRVDSANLTINNTHEWHTRGKVSHTPGWQNVPIRAFTWQLSKLRKGNIVLVKDVSKMPVSAKQEKAFMDNRGVTSFLALPLTTHNKLAGFIGLDNIEQVRNWSSEEIELLGIPSHTIGNVLEYEATQSLLSDSDRAGSNPVRTSTDGIIMVRDDTVIFANHTMHEMLGYEEPELMGISLHKLLPSNQEGTASPDYNTLMQGKDILPNFELQLVKKSRDTLWVTLTQNMVEYNGTLTMLGFVQDITHHKWFEHSFQDGEQEYDTLVESMPCGMVQVQDGIAIYANRRFCNIFNLEKSHVIGNDLSQLFTGPLKDTLSMASKDVKRIFVSDISAKPINNAKPHTYELPLTINSHVTIWTEVHTNYLTYKGSLTRILFFHDITSRRQAEEAIGESEDLYRAIFDSPLHVVFINNLQGYFLKANTCAENTYGYTEQELKLMAYQEVIHPDDMPRVHKSLAQVIASDSIPTLEFRVYRKSREIRWINTLIIPVKRNGEIYAVMGIAQDITQWKTTEDKLQESQDSLRNTINNLRDIYFRIDIEGTVVLVNPAALQFFQYDTVDKVIGKNITETLLYPDDLAKSFAEFISHSAAYDDTYIETSDITLAAKSGEMVTLEIMVSSTRDQSGQLIGVEGIARDTTEWKRVEIQRENLLKDLELSNAKLVESNQELQDFVHIASHDLREPLRKISAFGEVLTDSLKGKLSKDQKENLDFMIDGATRMQAMVDALLVYSRVTKGGVPLENVDLNRVINDLVQLELASQLTDTTGIIDIPEPLPTVLADDTQMHQLLHNLIGNGLKYHKQDCSPRITIRADSAGDQMVKISVEDTGIGISEEHFGEVFTMFKRLHSVREYEGTGIGLAVCKRIVERHGGQIGVESIPGKGAIFWFTIPAA